MSIKITDNTETLKDAFLKIHLKYPDKIPVILVKKTDTDVPDLDKYKYLLPFDTTISQFMFIIRKRIKLTPEKALYFFVNNTIPPLSSTISSLYREYKHESGFLFIHYAGESTYG